MAHRTQRIPDLATFRQLEALAVWLGWNDLRQESHVYSNPDYDGERFGETIFYYEAGHYGNDDSDNQALGGLNECRLQINCDPIGQFERFAGAVYVAHEATAEATAIDIFSGFYSLPELPHTNWTNAQRDTVYALLAREHLLTESARAKYVDRHPDALKPHEPRQLPMPLPGALTT